MGAHDVENEGELVLFGHPNLNSKCLFLDCSRVRVDALAVIKTRFTESNGLYRGVFEDRAQRSMLDDKVVKLHRELSQRTHQVNEAE